MRTDKLPSCGAQNHANECRVPVLTVVFQACEDQTMQVILDFVLLTVNQLVLGTFQMIVSILDGSFFLLLEGFLTPR